MITTARRKAGRPLAFYRDRHGNRIEGLSRLGDGRWRASGPERFTYSEPDEDLAIARFRRWQAGQGKTILYIPVASAKVDDQVAIRRAIQSLPQPEADPTQLRGTFLPPAMLAGLRAPSGAGTPTRVELDGDILQFFREPTNIEAFWPWLAKLILREPKYVAQMTGIEQIGYLAELPKPSPSPTLDEIGKLYLTHAKISENWRAKCKAFWSEFVDAVEVRRLRDLTQEDIVDYADMVMHTPDTTPTYARQRFGAIKTILNYPPKRGKWAEHCKRALAFCGVLVPPRKAAMDPRPISPEYFHALYRAADEQMRAILLLSLNACLYGGEVAAVNWSDLDLDKATLIAKRSKTGISRIAILWPATVAAIRRLSRRSDALFFTEAGTQADYLCVYRIFKTARKSARLEDVQFSDIRDGSYTAAVEAGIDLNTCKLLAGHATGISDHYVKRRPQMVAAACAAVATAYRVDTLVRQS